MIDRYGRPLEDLRITLTHVCNFSCFFCHMEGEGLDKLQGLGLEDILLVAKVSREFGVRSVKLTGGEPTLRKDLLEVVGGIKGLGIGDVSMTTNGVLLGSLAEKLKEAGLDRVNVSLHAVSREKFRKITGVDAFDKVIYGIKRAVEVGLRPIKLNYVVNKKNEDEVFSFLELAQGLGVDEVHLIELHPVGLGKEYFSYHEGLGKIEEFLKRNSRRVEVRNKHFRPRYYLDGGLVVEVVKPYANPVFCAGCNRIRLTADGKLKTCLYRDDKVIDIRHAFDPSVDKREREELVRHAFQIAMSIREPNFKYIYETGQAR
ncbi:MAG: GTP 3',8-cyclase MoaA [Candidatus Aramenus sp.]|jgi:cyclic pyranopterin phosphate synthase|nr:GTP 3',8-cyclase MoaA [Candidatus Aramenus sp.]